MSGHPTLEQFLAEIETARAELACLSSSQRQALILTAQGFSGTEGAQRMAIAVTTFSNHLCAAKDRLEMNTAEACVQVARARWV